MGTAVNGRSDVQHFPQMSERLAECGKLYRGAFVQRRWQIVQELSVMVKECRSIRSEIRQMFWKEAVTSRGAFLRIAKNQQFHLKHRNHQFF
jgi:hypothetical protein